MSTVIDSFTSLIGQMTFSEKRTALHLLMNSIDSLLIDPLESPAIPVAAPVDAPSASAPSTPVKKAKKVKVPGAPKRPAAPGVKAWCAFVKHCKTTQPELFKEAKKEAERLAICGGIKERDTPAYEAWVAEWLASSPPVSDSEDVIVVSDSEDVIVVSDSDVDADLLKMTGQELRDTWAALSGKAAGLKSTGKLSNKDLLKKAIMVLRAEKVVIKQEPVELEPRQIAHPVVEAAAPAAAVPAPVKKATKKLKSV
jgi:hypothetical protein